jgi:hypothetical protein
MSENVVAVRSIEIVTAEITMIRDNARRVFLESVIQIGTRLEEAKQLVPQGEWTAYLTDKLGYKPSTAQNYMRIAREFGGGQVSLTGKTAADAFGQLSYSQILPLLGMAEEEREELAEENDLPSMSSREIAALVKERDEAKANADRLKEKDKLLRSKLREANKERDKAQSSLSDATQREKDLAERLDELEKRPAEVRELTEEELEEIRSKVREENAEAAKAAEERARAAEKKLDKVKNPAAHKVNFLFGEVRGLVERLEQALAELQQSDEAAREKFAKVIADWLRREGDRLA